MQELPDVLREQVRLAVEKLIDGPDAEVEGALEDLDQLLEPHPDLRDRFFHLRVVDDAVEFLSSRAKADAPTRDSSRRIRRRTRGLRLPTRR